MKKTLAFLLAFLLLSASACAEIVYTTDMIQEKGPGLLSDEPITLTFFKGANTQKTINFNTVIETKWLEDKTKFISTGLSRQAARKPPRSTCSSPAAIIPR